MADTSTCSATSCTVCTAPANATPACAGASCDFTCEAGYVRCGGACFPAAQGCPPPAGSCAYRMEWYNNRDSAVGGISVAGVTGNVSQAFFLYATSYLGHTAWVFEVSQAPVGGACPNNGGGVIWSVTCPSASGSSTYRGENGAIYTCDAYGALAIRPINPY